MLHNACSREYLVLKKGPDFLSCHSKIANSEDRWSPRYKGRRSLYHKSKVIDKHYTSCTASSSTVSSANRRIPIMVSYSSFVLAGWPKSFVDHH